jgi:hypothetical protein
MSTEEGGWSRLRADVRPIDVAAIASVPAVLLGAFALPVSTRESLAFSADAPMLVSAYTAHFVHVDPGHLVGNLAVYGLVVPAAYLLAVLGGRRECFFIPFVAVLLSFPFALSSLHLSLDRPGRVLGFSGLNMAFVAVIPLFETIYLSRLDGGVRLDHAPTLFFAGVSLISYRILPGGATRTVLTLGAAVLAVSFAAYAWRRLGSGAIRDLVGRSGEFELVAGATVVFFLAVIFGSPSDRAQSGTVVDVYAHLFGYVVGFVATYLVFRIDDPTRRIPSPPGDGPE